MKIPKFYPYSDSADLGICISTNPGYLESWYPLDFMWRKSPFVIFSFSPEISPSKGTIRLLSTIHLLISMPCCQDCQFRFTRSMFISLPSLEMILCSDLLTSLESVVPCFLRMTSLTVVSPKTSSNSGDIWKKTKREWPSYGKIKKCFLNKVLNCISWEPPICRELLDGKYYTTSLSN